MDEQSFLAAALKNPANEAIARAISELGLPDAWLVSGCLVQTVWNVLSGRAVGYGINDYDVFYFDADTSWEAEDAVIRKVEAKLERLGVKVEARNQARVHLCYGEKNGTPYSPLNCSTEGIDRFLTANTMVGIRHAADGYEVYAPNGFDDIERMVVRPNRAPNFSAANYAAKAARWKRMWPEVRVIEADDVIASEAKQSTTTPRR